MPLVPSFISIHPFFQRPQITHITFPSLTYLILSIHLLFPHHIYFHHISSSGDSTPTAAVSAFPPFASSSLTSFLSLVLLLPPIFLIILPLSSSSYFPARAMEGNCRQVLGPLPAAALSSSCGDNLSAALICGGRGPYFSISHSLPRSSVLIYFNEGSAPPRAFIFGKVGGGGAATAVWW